MAKEIPLTRGKVALVDDEDYDWLSKFTWHAHGKEPNIYAARHEPRSKGHKIVLMHREILKARAGIKIDHRDTDSLHNCRINLRYCTHQQNMMNRRPNAGRRLKGVYPNCVGTRWQARIRLNRKDIYLGTYDTETQAAVAYDAAAMKHHGEFARLNFPSQIGGH